MMRKSRDISVLKEIQVSNEKQKSANNSPNIPPPPKKKLIYFKCFSSLCKNIVVGTCFFFSFHTLNITGHHGLKTCSRCRRVLKLLSTGEADWYIFIIGATPLNKNPRKAREDCTLHVHACMCELY